MLSLDEVRSSTVQKPERLVVGSKVSTTTLLAIADCEEKIPAARASATTKNRHMNTLGRLDAWRSYVREDKAASVNFSRVSPKKT